MTVSYKMAQTFNPAIRISGIYPRDEIAYSSQNLHIMFIAMLFIGAPNWKLSKCHLMGEGLNTLLEFHSMEYYSAIKRDKVPVYPTAQRNLK